MALNYCNLLYRKKVQSQASVGRGMRKKEEKKIILLHVDSDPEEQEDSATSHEDGGDWWLTWESPWPAPGCAWWMSPCMQRTRQWIRARWPAAPMAGAGTQLPGHLWCLSLQKDLIRCDQNAVPSPLQCESSEGLQPSDRGKWHVKRTESDATQAAAAAAASRFKLVLPSYVKAVFYSTCTSSMEMMVMKLKLRLF